MKGPAYSLKGPHKGLPWPSHGLGVLDMWLVCDPDQDVESGSRLWSVLWISEIHKIPIPSYPNFAQFNRRWTTYEPHGIWKGCWRKLWSGLCHQRTSFTLWKILNHSYYTNQREALWGIDPLCPMCKATAEFTKHQFFTCTRVSLCGSGFLCLPRDLPWISLAALHSWRLLA